MKVLFWLQLIFLAFILVVLSAQWTHPPDSAYLKELFERSQWRIPLSTRIMSDEQLFQYGGNHLVAGGEIFSVNPETPPLGKYLFGWTNWLTGNPYLATPLIFAVVLVCFYRISRRLTPDRQLSRFLVLSFALTPLVFSQLTQTMLDLPQLMFLLLHITFLFRIKSTDTWQNQVLWATVSGINLGFYSATKLPIFAPLIGLLAFFYTWRIKKWWLIVPLGFTAVLSCLAVYSTYFLSGHSLYEWLGAQKWIFQFYRQGSVSSPPWNFAVSVMSGWYHGWWNTSWQRIPEWSLAWPLSFIAPVIVLLQLKRQRLHLSVPSFYIVLLTIVHIGVNFLLPFWPRYYLLLFPFGLLCVQLLLSSFGQIKLRWYLLAAIILSIEALLFIRPTQVNLNVAVESWQKGNYQDLYTHLTPENRQNTSRAEFHQTLKRVELTTGKPQVAIEFPQVWPWQNQVEGHVTLIYPTLIGPFTHQAPISAIRQGAGWQLQWNWLLALPSFAPTTQVSFQPTYPTFGRLITQDLVRITTTGEVSALSIIPDRLESERDLPLVTLATGMGKNELDAYAFVESIGSWPNPVGDLITNNPVVMKDLENRPGFVVSTHPGVFFLEPYKTKGRAAWNHYPTSLHQQLEGRLGGRLVVTDDQGMSTVLLEVPPTPGVDVQIQETSKDLLFETVVGKPE